jgi:cullin 3
MYQGRKEINMSTLSMIVLLTIFNDRDSETFTEIQTETNIPAPELKRTLQGLSLGKYKLLLKSSKGKEVLESDSFAFNAGFVTPLNKIKILTVSAGGSARAVEADSENQETMSKIEEERKHAVDGTRFQFHFLNNWNLFFGWVYPAAIVRVMKSRKRLDHGNLVAEVIKMLSSRFSPSPGLVKKCIEVLIDREFLERDSSDRYETVISFNLIFNIGRCRKYYNYLA